MLNLPVIITPLRTYFCGQTSFWMKVIYLQHLLIEYLEKYNFLKIVDGNSIFADMKSIVQLFVDVFLPTWNNLVRKTTYRLYYINYIHNAFVYKAISFQDTLKACFWCCNTLFYTTTLSRLFTHVEPVFIYCMFLMDVFLVQLCHKWCLTHLIIEKKWRTQVFDFLSLKSLCPGQFLGSSNSCWVHLITKFSNFFL